MRRTENTEGSGTEFLPRGPRVKVLIADDHPLIRFAIRRTLEVEGGFDVVAEADSGSEVMPLIGRTSADVVLLDLQMAGIDGLDCLRRIVARHPEVKVIVMSVSASPDHIEAAFRTGARGYVVKCIALLDLASAIRQAIRGTAYHAQALPSLNNEIEPDLGNAALG